MKRYLVFAGACYYENIGFRDAVGQFNDIQTAEKFAKSLMGESIYHDGFNGFNKYEWYQIADLETFKIIMEDQEYE